MNAFDFILDLSVKILERVYSSRITKLATRISEGATCTYRIVISTINAINGLLVNFKVSRPFPHSAELGRTQPHPAALCGRTRLHF